MKALLMSLLAVALIGGLVGGGLFAYFSDTETSLGNTFRAGTLDLVLSDDDEFDQDGVIETWMVTTPPDWKPGEEVTATIIMKNIGSIGSYFAYLKPTVLVESDGANASEGETNIGVCNIADWINVTQFQVTYIDTTSQVEFISYGNWAPGWMTTCGAWGTTPPLTLREFQETVWWVVVWGSSRAPDDALEANGTNIIKLEITLQFEPTAPNDYQDDTCTMTFTVATGNEYPLVLHEIWHGSGGYGYAGSE